MKTFTIMHQKLRMNDQFFSDFISALFFLSNKGELTNCLSVDKDIVCFKQNSVPFKT